MIKRCDNQHYYDSDKFPTCPFCQGADMKNGRAPINDNPVLPQLHDEDDDVTVPLAFYQRSSGTAAPVNPAAAAPVPPSEIPAPSQAPVSDLPYNKLLPPLPFMNRPAPQPEPAVPVAPSMSPSQIEPEQTVPMAAFMPPTPVTTSTDTTEPTISTASSVAVPPVDSAAAVPMPSATPNDVIKPAVPVTLPVVPPVDSEPTAPVTPPIPAVTSTEMAAAQPEHTETDKTHAVVGWLVALNGDAYGESFELKGSRNVLTFVPELTVSAAENDTVPQGAVSVAYIAAEKACRILPCGEGLTVTVNGDPVTEDRLLAAYDRLTVGTVQLLFFPLTEKA